MIVDTAALLSVEDCERILRTIMAPRKSIGIVIIQNSFLDFIFF